MGTDTDLPSQTRPSKSFALKHAALPNELRGVWGFALALALVIAAALLTRMLLMERAEIGTSLFYLAILLVCVYCSLRASLFAVLIAIVPIWLLFGRLEWSAFPSKFPRLVLYAVVSGALVYLVHRVKHLVREQAVEREWWQKSLTSIGEGLIVANREGRIRFLNPAAQRLTGWTLEAAVGRTFEDVFQLERDPNKTCISVSAALNAGQADWLPAEGTLVSKDGRSYPVSNSVAPLTDEAGTTAGIVVVFHDDSKQRDINDAMKQSRRHALKALKRAIQARNRLRKRKEFNRGVLDSMIAHIAVLNQDGMIVDVNATWRHFARENKVAGGLAAQAFVGVNYLDVCRQASGEVLEAQQALSGIGKVLDGSIPNFTLEYSCHSPQERRWFLMSVTPLRAPYGGAVVSHLNITKRKLAEEKLTLFRALVDQASDTFEVIDPKTAQLLDVNDNACLMHGYTRAELLALTVPDLDPGQTLADFHTLVQTARMQGPVVLESTHRRKDGTVFPIEKNVKIVRLDREYCIALVRDISERQRAQNSLYESEARFQQLVANIHEGFWLVDIRSNHKLYMSPAIPKIWGRSLQDFNDTPALWLECIHPDDRKRMAEVNQAHRRSVLRGDWTAYDEKYRIIRPDGSIRWVHDRGFPVRDSAGAVVRIAGVAEDITEFAQLESQLLHSQKMEAFGLLAGGVAHDFNNILSVISGYSEMWLAKLPPTEPVCKPLRAIREAGERAAGLTRQLLAFSRQTVLTPQILDLNTLVRETEKMLRRLIGEDIAIVMQLDPQLPRIKVDPGQIGQVLMNLAVNARDAMPRGGRLTIATHAVELDAEFVRTHLDSRPGRHVVLTVGDTGTGMTAAVQKRIFEPFFTTKGVARGTGLGLAVVHGIVKQSGGLIEVASEVDVGTTFTLYFPISVEPLSPIKSSVSLPAVHGGETILLVEDEETLRVLAAEILQTQGYRVLIARDGENALELAASHTSKIDLLAADVVMPGISGRELAEKLTKQRPGVKVLFMSGYTDDAIVRHGITQNEVAFLQKPYAPLALLKGVRDALDT